MKKQIRKLKDQKYDKLINIDGYKKQGLVCRECGEGDNIELTNNICRDCRIQNTLKRMYRIKENHK